MHTIFICMHMHVYSLNKVCIFVIVSTKKVLLLLSLLVWHQKYSESYGRISVTFLDGAGLGTGNRWLDFAMICFSYRNFFHCVTLWCRALPTAACSFCYVIIRWHYSPILSSALSLVCWLLTHKGMVWSAVVEVCTLQMFCS